MHFFSYYADLLPVAYHQFLPQLLITNIIMYLPILGYRWVSYPGLPIRHWIDLACFPSSNTEQSSRSSVVRVSRAKAGGLGFDPRWLPMHFFSQFVYYADLPPVSSTSC